LLAERLDDVRDRIEELTRDEARTATIRSLDRTAEELKARLDGLEDRVERELTAPELETARHFGTRLGDLERRVAEIHADMEGVRSLRDALEPLLAESRARLGELREGLAERDDWLRRLERALSERDRRVEVLSRTVAQRDAQLEALQADLDRRDALLERYAERLDARTPPGLEERATLHTGPGPDAPAAGVDQADDLQRIRGVGPKFERALRELGVHRYAQIAAWSDADIEAVATKLGIKPSRIHRAGWIASAKALLDADRTP
jgi:predicted flap endonuclease-1-like 5' DNA nuclease